MSFRLPPFPRWASVLHRSLQCHIHRCSGLGIVAGLLSKILKSLKRNSADSKSSSDLRTALYPGTRHNVVSPLHSVKNSERKESRFIMAVQGSTRKAPRVACVPGGLQASRSRREPRRHAARDCSVLLVGSARHLGGSWTDNSSSFVVVHAEMWTFNGSEMDLVRKGGIWPWKSHRRP